MLDAKNLEILAQLKKQLGQEQPNYQLIAPTIKSESSNTESNSEKRSQIPNNIFIEESKKTNNSSQNQPTQIKNNNSSISSKNKKKKSSKHQSWKLAYVSSEPPKTDVFSYKIHISQDSKVISKQSPKKNNGDSKNGLHDKAKLKLKESCPPQYVNTGENGSITLYIVNVINNFRLQSV